MISSLELVSVDGVDHVSEVLVFLVRLNAGVVDVRERAEVVDLGLAVHVSNGPALLGGEREQLGLLSGREALEVRDSLLHLLLEQREQRVVLVLHQPRGDPRQCRFE